MNTYYALRIVSFQSADVSEISLIIILELEGNFLLINHILSRIKRRAQKQVKPRGSAETCRWNQPTHSLPFLPPWQPSLPARCCCSTWAELSKIWSVGSDLPARQSSVTLPLPDLRRDFTFSK